MKGAPRSQCSVSRRVLDIVEHRHQKAAVFAPHALHGVLARVPPQRGSRLKLRPTLLARKRILRREQRLAHFHVPLQALPRSVLSLAPRAPMAR